MNLVFEVSTLAVNMVLLVAAFFKELQRNLTKLGVAQHIFILLNPLGALHAEFIQFGSQQISWTAGNGFFVADDFLAEFIGNGSRSFAVLAFDETLKLLGDHFIPLAGDNVENSLGSNDL